MTIYECYRCKKPISDGDVVRLHLDIPVHFDPVCWSAAVDEIVQEILDKAARARAAVGTVRDEVRPGAR